MQDLAEHLVWLANNQEEYDSYLRFKQPPSVSQRFSAWWLTPRPAWQCRLCDYVKGRTPRQFWRDQSCAYITGRY